jgi:hypothetical protein
MEPYYIKEYIKGIQALFGKKQIAYCLPCLGLGIPNVFLSIYLRHDMFMAGFIIGYNALIVVALLAGIVFNRHDWLVLGYAFMYSGMSASFAFVGFYICDSYKTLLLCCLMLYMSGCAIRIFCVNRSVKSGGYKTKQSTKPRKLLLAVLLLSIPATGVGQILARVMVAELSYSKNMTILVSIVFFLVLTFSLGSHLYLCFYYMRKYKVK